jgi:hypothetical protein
MKMALIHLLVMATSKLNINFAKKKKKKKKRVNLNPFSYYYCRKMWQKVLQKFHKYTSISVHQILSLLNPIHARNPSRLADQYFISVTFSTSEFEFQLS